MKLSHARLTEGIQAKPGRLGTSGPLTYPEYELVLISNLRSIKVDRPGHWDEPVFIPVEKFDCFSPLEGEFKR